MTLIYKGSMTGKGIIHNNGTDWKEMRRFTLKTLRNFGVGKASMEDTILEECDHLIDYFEGFGSNNNEVNLDQIFNRIALNIIWKMHISW